MKSSYIRILLLGALVMSFVALTNRWEEMFPSAPAVEHEQQSSNSVNSSAPEQVANQKLADPAADKTDHNLDNTMATAVTVNTDVFKNLTISQHNGAITKACLAEYHVSLDNHQPMPLLTNNPGHQYIAQSVIVIDGKTHNIVFRHQNTVTKGNHTTVTMVAKINDLLITRDYVFDNDNYAIDVSQKVENNSAHPVSISFNHQIIRHVDPETHSFSLFDAHAYSFKGVGLSSTNKPFQKEAFTDLGATPIQVSTTSGWAAMIEQYFVSLWVPNNKGATFTAYGQEISKNTYQTGITTLPVVVNKGDTLTNNSIFYAGPIITKNLEAMVSHFGKDAPKGLDQLVDYGLLSFISVIIFWLMGIIYGWVGNWGLAIILVTVLIKLLFYPLSAKSYKSMAKLRMLQPRMKKLQELYKGDRQKLGRKMMELYKQEKANPASGCLPILIQIPVFIALYWVLLESVQLRQAPFVFWVHDLASKDPYFVLPILMGISMFIQQKLSPTSADPTQAKIMMLMPVIFTVFFASFPSGLVLYWLTNNVISIFQQWYITKKYTATYKAKRA